LVTTAGFNFTDHTGMSGAWPPPAAFGVEGAQGEAVRGGDGQ
jgi:hypothetical protein